MPFCYFKFVILLLSYLLMIKITVKSGKFNFFLTTLICEVKGNFFDINYRKKYIKLDYF